MLEVFGSAEDTSAGETGGTSLNTGRMRGGGGVLSLYLFFFFFFLESHDYCFKIQNLACS